MATRDVRSSASRKSSVELKKHKKKRILLNEYIIWRLTEYQTESKKKIKINLEDESHLKDTIYGDQGRKS